MNKIVDILRENTEIFIQIPLAFVPGGSSDKNWLTSR